MMTDPIGDMLTRIRNAGRVKHDKTTCPASKARLAIAKVLSQEGFLGEVQQVEDDAKPVLVLNLRYAAGGRPMIDGIQRVSRPGRRIYVAAGEIRKVRNGLGMAVLSTSKGILCDRDARAANVGGEVICEVW